MPLPMEGALAQEGMSPQRIEAAVSGFRSTYGQDLLGGRDVSIMWQKIAKDREAEDVGEELMGYGKGKTSAHETSECSSMFSYISESTLPRNRTS